MNMNQITDYGTNHPNSKLPSVPPSFDESILYNQHVSLFLRLPNQLNPGANKNGRFWSELNRRNKCLAKMIAKMLCVLYSTKQGRDNLLTMIANSPIVWDNNSINDAQKTVKLCELDQSQVNITAVAMTVLQFDNKTNDQKMNGIYLIWCDISLTVLMSKNMYNDWASKLKTCYEKLVGQPLD